MPKTREEINTKYLKLHNALGRQKDASDKDKFDKAHQKIWADCEAELKKEGYIEYP